MSQPDRHKVLQGLSDHCSMTVPRVRFQAQQAGSPPGTDQARESLQIGPAPGAPELTAYDLPEQRPATGPGGQAAFSRCTQPAEMKVPDIGCVEGGRQPGLGKPRLAGGGQSPHIDHEVDLGLTQSGDERRRRSVFVTDRGEWSAAPGPFRHVRVW